MARVMFLFGSGGHSAEMLMLVENSGVVNKVDNITCIVSSDDNLIGTKLTKIKNSQLLKLARGRRVGQSLLTSIITIILSFFHAIFIVINHRPQIFLTNGPAIGLIMTLAIRCLQVITIGFCYQCRITYIESFCRTRTLSLTGKLIYQLRLANRFYVQWPYLKIRYPRAEYAGILV